MMDLVRRESIGKVRSKSCLVLNCVLERAHADDAALAKAQSVLADHENVFVRLIRDGQKQGSISKEIRATDTAKLLLGLTIAMRVYGKAQAPHRTIQVLFQQAAASLETPISA